MKSLCSLLEVDPDFILWDPLSSRTHGQEV